MQWQSWQAFFNMGGYAFFVWTSFGITALCMIWEVVALRLRNREALRITHLLAQNAFDFTQE